jgi:hypothetical protein
MFVFLKRFTQKTVLINEQLKIRIKTYGEYLYVE